MSCCICIHAAHLYGLSFIDPVWQASCACITGAAATRASCPDGNMWSSSFSHISHQTAVAHSFAHGELSFNACMLSCMGTHWVGEYRMSSHVPNHLLHMLCSFLPCVCHLTCHATELNVLLPAGSAPSDASLMLHRSASATSATWGVHAQPLHMSHPTRAAVPVGAFDAEPQAAPSTSPPHATSKPASSKVGRPPLQPVGHASAEAATLRNVLRPLPVNSLSAEGLQVSSYVQQPPYRPRAGC